MVFNSFAYLVFFGCVYTAYMVTMRRLRLQNGMLLVASYVFYGWWDWRFLALIALSTTVDYVCGRLLDRRKPDHGDSAEPVHVYSITVRRALLWLSVVFNLGLLGTFKYFNFFVGEFASMLGTMGVGWQPRLLDIILPVGISFYTFQTMSYTIDVYLRRQTAERSLLNFALFVSFFPQLVAGPIARASELLPQIAQCRRLGLQQTYEGCYLVLWGLFKKVVIADSLARLVDSTFHPGNLSPNGGQVIVAVYAFAIQIYCDFSGYTDIGRGCSKLLGIELPLNFRLPYFATSPRDFWRRWHITLSEWLRDYVYIPLGGSKSGHRRTLINLMITMVLGGLWHGAAWTFVAWGVFHGTLLILDHVLRDPIQHHTKRLPDPMRRWMPWISRLACFHLVCFGWLLFRAETLSQAGHMVHQVFTGWPCWIIAGSHTIAATGLLTLLGYALPMILIQIDQHRRNDLDMIFRLPVWARGVVYSAMFYAVVMWGERIGRAFIYFQF